jgi:hypothetical protein
LSALSNVHVKCLRLSLMYLRMTLLIMDLYRHAQWKSPEEKKIFHNQHEFAVDITNSLGYILVHTTHDFH